MGVRLERALEPARRLLLSALVPEGHAQVVLGARALRVELGGGHEVGEGMASGLFE